MSNIKVSVIVPVYKVEKYLAKCLDSLAAQTLDSIEIIIVNDGSPDNSQEIIDQYIKKYPDTMRAFKKENGGLGSARNFGLTHARGEYIGFVDSDDWVDSRMFELLYKKAVADKCDVVLCDYTSLYDGWDHGWCSKGFRGGYTPTESLDYMLYSLEPAFACNKLFHKKLFDILVFSETWYEDMATTPVLLSYANRIGYVEMQLYYYRQREGSIVFTSQDQRSKQVVLSWDRSIQNVKDEYKDAMVFAVYKSIHEFISFKPEHADSYLEYARDRQDLFKDNRYIQQKIKSHDLPDLVKKQLIPKKIHYFWFGGNPKSELILKCIESWKIFAPDYEIIEWNESNCDVNECKYVSQAYKHKKWAFVADYFRIKKIYEHGGIYVDTDMEFNASIEILRTNSAFFEFETKQDVNSCIFGAVAGHDLVKKWLDTYLNDSLENPDGSLNTSYTIVVRLSQILKRDYNLLYNGMEQTLKGDVKIYPPNVLILDAFDGRNIAVHHYDASWWDVKSGMASYKHEVLKNYFSDSAYSSANSSADAALRIELEQVYNSTSWRVTAPLRKLKDALTGANRR